MTLLADEEKAHMAWMTLVQHFKDRSDRAEAVAKEALRLLGDTLYFIADVHPDDRCLAVDEALQFYNAQCPERRVAPSGIGIFRMVQEPLMPTESPNEQSVQLEDRK